MLLVLDDRLFAFRRTHYIPFFFFYIDLGISIRHIAVEILILYSVFFTLFFLFFLPPTLKRQQPYVV